MVQGNLYFSTLTLVIAIPTGAKFYNWLFLIYSQPYNIIQPSSPLSFIFLSMIIGVTGIVLGNNTLDIQPTKLSQSSNLSFIP